MRASIINYKNFKNYYDGKKIKKIKNYYGGLEIKKDHGKYYWGIEDYDGIDYQEIPKYLYDALVKFFKFSDE